MSRRKTLSEFIQGARAIHGDKYDYSLAEYKTNKHKAKIICPKHGVFEQTPNRHLQGDNCPACMYEINAEKATKNTEHFIRLARERYGDKYDYSLVEYKGRRTTVEIICPVHGATEQTPDFHLRGHGCKRCGIESRAKNASMTFGDFVAKSRDAHGDQYEYVKASYKKSSCKVRIICKKHGEFEQLASLHAHGQQCPKCAIEKNAQAKRDKWDRDSFLQDMARIHDGKYSYEKTEYTAYKEKITVTCPDHGDFDVWYFNHVNGCGCPLCSFDRDKPHKVYVLQSDSGFVKVGIARSVEQRIRFLRKRTPFAFTVAAKFSARNYPDALAIERKAHTILAQHHAGMSGFDGATEWFHCDIGDAITAVSEAKAAS